MRSAAMSASHESRAGHRLLRWFRVFCIVAGAFLILYAGARVGLLRSSHRQDAEESFRSVRAGARAAMAAFDARDDAYFTASMRELARSASGMELLALYEPGVKVYYFFARSRETFTVEPSPTADMLRVPEYRAPRATTLSLTSTFEYGDPARSLTVEALYSVLSPSDARTVAKEIVYLLLVFLIVTATVLLVQTGVSAPARERARAPVGAPSGGAAQAASRGASAAGGGAEPRPGPRPEPHPESRPQSRFDGSRETPAVYRQQPRPAEESRGRTTVVRPKRAAEPAAPPRPAPAASRPRSEPGPRAASTPAPAPEPITPAIELVEVEEPEPGEPLPPETPNRLQPDREPQAVPAAAAEPESAAPHSRGIYAEATGLVYEELLATRLRSELDRAAASDQDLVLTVIGIDGWDSMAGRDAVRAAIASRLRDTFPYRDLAFEHGKGFAVIVPDLNLDRALVQLEDFRARVEQAPIEGQRVTVSVGIGARNGRLLSEETLLKEATHSLMKAEREGANQVVAFRADPAKFRKVLAP